MIKVSGFNRKGMQKRLVIALIFLCIAMIVVAGCSSSQSASTAPAPQTPSVKTIKTTLAPTAAQTLSQSPSQFSGSGDDVVSFTATGTGLRVFTMSYTGKSNFAVWLQGSDGSKIDLLANTIDAYSGKKSVKITPGKYYLDVTASGPWTIGISTP